uniref:Uncharacterized protein n=1 Tax=Oryza glumipatula TaxID=40148 RepID=A0A0E0ARP2_9ORYZ
MSKVKETTAAPLDLHPGFIFHHLSPVGLFVVMISLAVAVNAGDVGAHQLFFLWALAVAGVNLITAGVYLTSRDDVSRRCTVLARAAAFARWNFAVFGTFAASSAATGVMLNTTQPVLCFFFFLLFISSLSLVTIGLSFRNRGC